MTIIPQLEFNLDWQHFSIFAIHEAQEFGSIIQENNNNPNTVKLFSYIFHITNLAKRSFLCIIELQSP